MKKVDVCIVGAGFSGLACALKLKKEGISCCILEARNRVGGRVHTEVLPNGMALDFGGTFLGAGNNRLHELARQYHCELKTACSGDKLLIVDGKIHRFSGGIPNIKLLPLIDLGLAIKTLDSMAKKVPLEAPWEAENARDLDALTLGQWIDKHTLSHTARKILMGICVEIFSSDPHEISLLHALFMVHSLNSLEWIISEEGGAQQEMMVGGMQTLAKRMASDLKDELYLNVPVSQIVQNQELLIYARGITVEAKKVIMALSPLMAGKIDYEPQLPQLRNHLNDRAPLGQIIRCYATYEKPFWREEGLSGVAIDADEAPQACIALNDDRGILTAYIWGPPARYFAEVSKEERKKVFLQGLVKRFGPKAAIPIHYSEFDWSNEKYSRGAVFSHYAPGVLTGFGKALRRPCGNIHWAGTECAIKWSGNIEGAILAGEAAAEEVLHHHDFV